MNKFLFLTLCLHLFSLSLFSQKQSIPMNSAYWKVNSETMKFDDHKGEATLHISGDGIASINDFNFKSGIIEYDYYPTELGFTGIYFRRQPGDDRTPELESEFFYLRSFKLDDPMASGAVQYAPIVKGTNLWDLLHDYEANGNIKSKQWNHIKLVISNQQMKCYLNGDLILWIPELLGPDAAGTIALSGKGIYANMQIQNENIEDLPNAKGADVTLHDVRYLREWEYSPKQAIPKNTAPTPEMFPDSTTTWTAISADRFGLINLTKHISSPFIEGKREMVWLSTTIESEFDQMKQLNLGFSDDIWVYVNGRFLYVDQNTYGQPISKQPNGRLHVDNSQINLPLRKGENKIMIALANDFFGWGLVARLDNMYGISNKMKH